MDIPAPSLLVFPDRRQKGRFPVTDAAGSTLAQISASSWGTSFTAQDADGNVLCAGSTNRWGLSRTWQSSGPDGRPLLSVTSRVMRTAGTVHLERGGDFAMVGSAWRRDFVVTGADDVTILSAVPRTSAWSFRPHDYAVKQERPVFSLAEVVAVVQIWRTVRKNDSSAAGGAVAATGATTA